MMVPTLTMLGRSWCPWRREAGMVVAVATGSLCPARLPEGHPRVRGRVSLTCSSEFDSVPPFDAGRLLTGWELAPVPLVVTVWAAGLYLLGVRALHRRGDAWPVGRTVMFVGVGMGAFYVATSSGLAAYDTTLLSVHMVQHMVLSMLVPLALALGAPVTLALRTLPRAPRRWLLAVLHSRVAKVLSFPPLTLALYVVSPVGALLLRLVRRHAGPRLAARADAPAPGRGRRAVLLADRRHRPGAGAGRLPVPDAAGGAHAAVPRVPGRHDHGPGDAARRRPLPRPARAARLRLAARTRSTTSTWPAACSGRRATWSGWCCSGCCSPSGSGPR